MAVAIQQIEAEMLARRTRPPDLPAMVRLAFGALPGGGECSPVLRLAALRIAEAHRRAASVRPEPAYHNSHHTAEAMTAMALLCRDAVEHGLLTWREAAIGVVAMAGHDLGHDGSVLAGGVLERRAQADTDDILAAAGVDLHDRPVIGDIILATAPDRIPANAARMTQAGPDATPSEILCVLANEADVFGSFQPRLGPILSKALAVEWGLVALPGSQQVAQPAGRLGFLRAYPALSGPAVRVGLETARARCLAAYATAGARLGVEATPEAGCAALGRLDPAEAERLYDQALAAGGG